MSKAEFVEGNAAIAHAAVKAGCKFFFGYPITPSTEILEHMARLLPRVGGAFVQAESEVAAISMVIGAAATGARAMTATSSPGISLMQEGISCMASMELPCVIVDVTRASPGLGRIAPAQSDYFQATKKGHGDFNVIVLAPASIQEMADFTALAFDLADKYRNPVMILCDGMLAHLMETMVWTDTPSAQYSKEWRIGADERRLILSAPLTDGELIELNTKLKKKFDRIRDDECRWDEIHMEDAEIAVAAFGTTARIVSEAIAVCRRAGIKVGMIRPITLWPFPSGPFRRHRAKAWLTIEMNNGQMVEDVRLAAGVDDVCFLGKGGGWLPTVDEIKAEVCRLADQIQ